MNNETKFSREMPPSERERIEEKEKEKIPDKIVLFVRHPSVKWLDFLLERAVKEKKDIETYAPVDIEGLRMSKKLTEYFKENLSKRIPKQLLEKGLSIITSPILRAREEADIIFKSLRQGHEKDPNIPIPSEYEENELFQEIPWIKNKQEALDLVKEAKEKNTHPVKLWFQKDPDEIIKKLNKEMPRIEKGIKYLEKTKTPVDLVFTHRISLALTLWQIEQDRKGKKDFTITKEDLPEIMDLTGQVAYTSITELNLTKGKWSIRSISETPHLEEEPELRKGIF